MTLKGKVAFVTGAGQAPGTQIAVALARAGAKVAVEGGGGVQELVLRVAADFGGETLPAPGDAANASDVQDMLSNVEPILGPVDILVNAAGVSLDPDGPVNASEHKAAAAAVCGDAIVPGMRRRGSGCVVHIVTAGEGGETAALVAERLTGVVIEQVGEHGGLISAANNRMTAGFMASVVVANLSALLDNGA